MSSKSSKGKRYAPKEKEEILAFVASVNEAKGRGGQSAAAEKFNISPLTISNWIKQAGKPAKKAGRPPKAASAKATKGTKAPKAAKSAKRASGGNFASNLRRLADLHEQISKTEAQLNKLRAEYSSLKGKL